MKYEILNNKLKSKRSQRSHKNQIYQESLEYKVDCCPLILCLKNSDGVVPEIKSRFNYNWEDIKLPYYESFYKKNYYNVNSCQNILKRQKHNVLSKIKNTF